MQNDDQLFRPGIDRVAGCGKCQHGNGVVVSYDIPGWRWIERCYYCNETFLVGHNGERMPIPKPNEQRREQQ